MTKPFQTRPDDAGLVVVTRAELRAMLADVVRDVIAEGAAANNNARADYVDASGAAALLGVHARTIGNLAKRGELAHSRVGRLLRFKRADVLALLSAGTSGR